MTIAQVLLKLNDHYGLSDTDELNRLTVDTKAWEKTCVEDSEDPIKRSYAKIHKGVLLRLTMPFFYFLILRYVNDIINPEVDNDID